jgi:hypothetical protein
LEEEMSGFLTYVPWEEGNANVWSPKLANLLINVGSSIDSAFKTFKNSRNLAAGKDAEKLREKEEPNIADYATTYGSVYPLASKAVHFLEDHSPLMPWQSWKATELRDRTPFWWYAYNQVKHDRFGNLKLAKLRTTLDALAGFFSVCVLLLEVRNHLFSLGRIRHVGFQKRRGEIRSETWIDGGPLEIVQVADLGDRFELPIYVSTNLFALFLSSDKNTQGQQELLEQIAPR